MNVPGPVVVVVGCMRPVRRQDGVGLNQEMLPRLRKAVQVANQKMSIGHCPVILMLCGGQTDSTIPCSEARFTEPYLRTLGLHPAVRIVLEECSENSVENLVKSREWIESTFPTDSVTVCLVGSDWHRRFFCAGAYVFTAPTLRWEPHPAEGNRFRADGTDRWQAERRGLHKLMLALSIAGDNYTAAPQLYREAISRPDEQIVAAIRLRIAEAVALPQP